MSTAGGTACGIAKECNNEENASFLARILKNCIRCRILSIYRNLHDVERMNSVLADLHKKLKKQPKACVTIIKDVIILIDKHTMENYHVGNKLLVRKSLLKEKKNHHVQTRWLHVSRTLSSDCNYRIVDGDTNAITTAGKKTGKGSCLSVKSQAMGYYVCHVH